MNFKLVYIFGFFFITMKSRSFPGISSFPLTDEDLYNMEGADPAVNTETALQKMLKFRDKLKPSPEQLSGLKNTLSNIIPKREEPDYGLGKLYGEEEYENPEKNPLFGGFNAGEKFGQAKDAIKNMNWPWNKKNHGSESPSDADYDEGGTSEKTPLFGNLNAGEKFQQAKDALGGFKPGEKFQQAKDALGGLKPGEKFQKATDAIKNVKWPWSKKNQDSESDDDGLDHNENLNPEENPLLGNFNVGEKFQQAKDALSGFKPGEKFQQAKDALGGLKPGEKFQQAKDALGGLKPGEKFQQAKDALGGLKPGEKFQKATDAIKNVKWPWGKKNQDSESPGDGGPEYDDNWSPEENPLFGDFNAGEKFQKAKDALSGFKPGEKFQQAKDALSGFKPGEKFQKAKDALKWPFGKKKDDSESPESQPEDNYEPEKEESSHHWPKFTWENPFKSGTSQVQHDHTDDYKPEKKEDSHYRWPVYNFKNPFKSGSSDNTEHHNASGNSFGLEPEDGTFEKKSGSEETPEEMMEEEIEKLVEEELKQPSNDLSNWADWNPWKDHEDPQPESHHHKHHEPESHHHKHHEPESHKSHSKEHEHGQGGASHFSDWPWNSHENEEPRGSKEHGKDDKSESEQLLPDWFTNPDENHESKTEEGENESPEQHHSSHSPKEHAKHHDHNNSSGGSMVPHIPDWFFSETQPERKPQKHHNRHSPLNQETFYDVRAIGDNNLKKSDSIKSHGKDDDDEEEDDEDDDDDDDDDEDEDKGNETDDYDTAEDNDIGEEEGDPDKELEPEEEEILKELNERNKSKPKRESEDEADDDDSDSDDDDDDDDDDDAENNRIYDDVDANFSIWQYILPMVAQHLPSVPNPFSLMNRMTVSFASINDLQRDPEYLHKSLIKKINQKYKEQNEHTVPGTTISIWPPAVIRG